MGEWTTHNRSVAMTQLQSFLNKKRKTLVSMLRDNADAMVMYVDRGFSPCPPYYGGGTETFPVWEGQMRDSTGVGLYVEGMTNYFMPVPKGNFPQSDTDKGIDNIVGREWLEESISGNTIFFPHGIWITLISAVPYGEKVNREGSPWGRGVGYFDSLKETFRQAIEMTAQNLKTV